MRIIALLYAVTLTLDFIPYGWALVGGFFTLWVAALIFYAWQAP